MRFLLIAPERRELGDWKRTGSPGGTRARDSVGPSGLLYLHLEQEYRSKYLEPTVPELPSDSAQRLADEGIHLEWIRRYSSPSGIVWSLLVDVAFDAALVGSTAELEEYLSCLAARILPDVGSKGLLWVSRTLIVKTGGPEHLLEAFAGWLERSHEDGRPTEPTYAIDRASFTVGWGNNLLCGCDPDTLLEVVETSLVVAQFLWAHVHALSVGASDSLVAGISLGRDGGREVEVNFFDRVELLTEELGIEHMLADEFTHGNQGAAIALRILRAWGFDEFQESTRRRILDLRGLAGDLRARRQGVYQRTVEWVLIIIGMVALLDVAVGSIQLAYAGGTTVIPGSDQSVSLLGLVRRVGADGSLLIGLIAVVIMLAVVAALVASIRTDRR